MKINKLAAILPPLTTFAATSSTAFGVYLGLETGSWWFAGIWGFLTVIVVVVSAILSVSEQRLAYWQGQRDGLEMAKRSPTRVRIND